MPAELFHPSISSVGARRRVSLLPISIAAHAIVLAAWFIAPLFAERSCLIHRAARWLPTSR